MPEFCADCGAPAVGKFDVPMYDGKGRAVGRPADLSQLNASDRSGYDRPLCAACSGRRPGTVRTDAPGAAPKSD